MQIFFKEMEKKIWETIFYSRSIILEMLRHGVSHMKKLKMYQQTYFQGLSSIIFTVPEIVNLK